MQPKTYFMEKELIRELFERFEQACYVINDIECWSARELQEILGYTKWSNFHHVKRRSSKKRDRFCANLFRGPDT